MTWLVGTLADTTSSGFPDFPGEHPSKADVERWITAWTEDLGTSGYGASTRNEVPYEVVKLKQLRPLLTVPTEPAAKAVIDGKNADIQAANDAI